MKLYFLFFTISVFGFQVSADVPGEVTTSQNEAESVALDYAGADIRCEEFKRQWKMGMGQASLSIKEYEKLFVFMCGEMKSGVGTLIDKQAAVKPRKLNHPKKIK